MNNNLTADLSAQLSEYKPPKMWKDLTADEKIERTREQIKKLKLQLKI